MAKINRKQYRKPPTGSLKNSVDKSPIMRMYIPYACAFKLEHHSCYILKLIPIITYCPGKI